MFAIEDLVDGVVRLLRSRPGQQPVKVRRELRASERVSAGLVGGLGVERTVWQFLASSLYVLLWRM